jgi:pimeloyl-ACP methyl ester carboxylesterase
MLELPNRFQFGRHRIAWGAVGEGDPLVLIHGTPFSAQVWRRIAPWLASRYRVFFYDLLGYGQSDMPDDDVSLGMQNELLTAILREWRLDRPSVVAHDFGGTTALRGHFLNGLEYSRLILIDPVAIAPQGSPFVRHVGRYEDAFQGLPAYAHEALLGASIQNAAARRLSDNALAIYRQPWIGERGQPAFYRQIAQMNQRYIEEVERRYTPPQFPVRILWGADDAWIPLDQGRKLAAKLTQGELTVVPDAGHLVHEDAPEAIVAAALT